MRLINQEEVLLICPYCKEKIAEGAVLCKHCKSDISLLTASPVIASSTQKARQNSSDLAQIIINYVQTYSGKKSKYIYTGDEIKSKYIENHRSKYLILEPDEKLLVMLNKGAIFGVMTGLTVTNQKIHFCTLKKSVWAGYLPWFFTGPKGSRRISDLSSIEIAESFFLQVNWYASSYIGHELRINDEILGYVRMGTFFDEKAVAFLNGLFDCLADSGILKRRVKNYS
jgi:hypothetical protein